MAGTYIGVATNTVIDLHAVTSIYKIEMGPQDYGPNWYHAARGDVSRSGLTDAFLKGTWDWCLYLDGDMTFPPDLLRRLMAHNKPFTGGLYFRRGLDPIYPLAFEYTDPPTLPFVPIFDYPSGGLLRVNATGSGCWLIHRDVFDAVKAEMRSAVKARLGLDLEHIPLIMDGPMPEIRDDYQRVGADLRFCYYARRAGYDIWLDCDLDIGHISHVPLARHHYDTQDQGVLLEAIKGVYGSTATTYRRQHMEKDALRLKMEQAKAHLAQIDAQVKAERDKIAAAQTQLKALHDRGNAVKGYIQGLQYALDEEAEG